MHYVRGRDFRVPRKLLAPWLAERLLSPLSWSIQPRLSSYQRRVRERDINAAELDDAKAYLSYLVGENAAAMREVDRLRQRVADADADKAELAALSATHELVLQEIVELRAQLGAMQMRMDELEQGQYWESRKLFWIAVHVLRCLILTFSFVLRFL